MDPTLAPGYVPPNNGKDKASKQHHWAEIQAQRTRSATDDSGRYGDRDTESDRSSVSLPTTPRVRPVTPQRPGTVDGSTEMETSRAEVPRHPRMSSWRGGRSTLSDGEGIGGPADLEEVPVGVKRQALRLDDYAFPEHRLRAVMDGIDLSFGD